MFDEDRRRVYFAGMMASGGRNMPECPFRFMSGEERTDADDTPYSWLPCKWNDPHVGQLIHLDMRWHPCSLRTPVTFVPLEAPSEYHDGGEQAYMREPPVLSVWLPGDIYQGIPTLPSTPPP